MKDFEAIKNAFSKVELKARKAAIATVVKVRGSSYRSPGARMLILDDGQWVGSISGGCLEGDALRKARQVMLDKRPMTVTYDTREESNQNLGIGLGCNGVIDVLIEPIADGPAQNPLTLLENVLSAQEPIAIATIFSPVCTGEKLILSASGKTTSFFSSQKLKEIVGHDLEELFETKRSEARQYTNEGKQVEIFLELIQPAISLIIFGGGFDARPVSQLAKSLGWKVMVTDECVAHIAPIFFPDADKLSLCQREFIDSELTITPFTACILMSHNYEYDRDVLKKLISSDSPYIGILGPRKRFDKMLEEFGREKIVLTNEDHHRIHSPIGLDIGAETPDEIAISIISEIQGKFSNRSGGFLKYRNAPIHHRDSKSDQVFKQVYISPPATAKTGQ
jgi:xanthine dehydrogenase accessory factor